MTIQRNPRVVIEEMIDMTQEQMKEKFRHDTMRYWAMVLIIQGVILVNLSLNVMTTILLAVAMMSMAMHALVYVRFIVTFSLPRSYYTNLENCLACGKTAVKRINRSKCLECGKVTER